jgi:hypothetical protein
MHAHSSKQEIIEALIIVPLDHIVWFGSRSDRYPCLLLR